MPAPSAADNRARFFQDAAHDYPQQIKYTRTADRLQATISLLGGARPASFDKVACGG